MHTTPEQSGRRLMTRVSFLSSGFTLALTAVYLMLHQAAFHSGYGPNTRYVVVEGGLAWVRLLTAAAAVGCAIFAVVRNGGWRAWIALGVAALAGFIGTTVLL